MSFRSSKNRITYFCSWTVACTRFVKNTVRLRRNLWPWSSAETHRCEYSCDENFLFRIFYTVMHACAAKSVVGKRCGLIGGKIWKPPASRTTNQCSNHPMPHHPPWKGKTYKKYIFTPLSRRRVLLVLLLLFVRFLTYCNRCRDRRVYYFRTAIGTGIRCYISTRIYALYMYLYAHHADVTGGGFVATHPRKTNRTQKKKKRKRGKEPTLCVVLWCCFLSHSL